ncbi:YjcZ family sporulation protein [Paenibacillus sp. J23TS9]
MSEFAGRNNLFTSTGAILVLFILLVIITKTFLY